MLIKKVVTSQAASDQPSILSLHHHGDAFIKNSDASHVIMVFYNCSRAIVALWLLLAFQRYAAILIAETSTCNVFDSLTVHSRIYTATLFINIFFNNLEMASKVKCQQCINPWLTQVRCLGCKAYGVWD